MRRPTPLSVIVLQVTIGLASISDASPAAPRGPAAPTAPAPAGDPKTYKEAVKLESDGDVVGALAKFESIPAAKRDSLVRLHIASCKRKLGRFLASQSDLEGILADAKLDVATRETAQSDLDDLRARTPKVSLRVSAATTGVVVTLDGEVVVPPTGRALDPGAHVVAATRDGRQVFKRELQLTEATSIDVEVDAPAPAPTSTAPRPLAPAPAPASAPASGSGLRTTGWILVAVGGVAGLGAAGAWWKSNSAYDDWTRSCGPTGCDGDQANRVRGWDRAKVVGAGVAIVGFGVGVTLLVAAPRGAGERPSASLTLKASSGAMNGLLLEGRF